MPHTSPDVWGLCLFHRFPQSHQSVSIPPTRSILSTSARAIRISASCFAHAALFPAQLFLAVVGVDLQVPAFLFPPSVIPNPARDLPSSAIPSLTPLESALTEKPRGRGLLHLVVAQTSVCAPRTSLLSV